MCSGNLKYALLSHWSLRCAFARTQINAERLTRLAVLFSMCKNPSDRGKVVYLFSSGRQRALVRDKSRPARISRLVGEIALQFLNKNPRCRDDQKIPRLRYCVKKHRFFCTTKRRAMYFTFDYYAFFGLLFLPKDPSRKPPNKMPPNIYSPRTCHH